MHKILFLGGHRISSPTGSTWRRQAVLVPLHRIAGLRNPGRLPLKKDQLIKPPDRAQGERLGYLVIVSGLK